MLLETGLSGLPFFYCSSSNIATRGDEAATISGHANLLVDANVLYAGDFNMLGASELAWSSMILDGAGQASDLANVPDECRDNPSFLSLHTQDPEDNMDDRFDLIFGTGELMDGNELEYVTDSFRVFGNNGTHTLGGSIDTGTVASPDVLASLIAASDHLPVVADFQVGVIPEPEFGPFLLAVSAMGVVIFLRRRTSSARARNLKTTA